MYTPRVKKLIPIFAAAMFCLKPARAAEHFGPLEKDAVFQTLSVVAKMEDRAPTVNERFGDLQVLAPYINVCATVEFSIPEGEVWELGFIQQIDKAVTEIEYTDATYTWEMPAYPMSDSSAHSDTCPWYNSPLKVRGTGGNPRTAAISMNDNVSTYSSWGSPGDPSAKPDLRGVRREQEFTLWLTARRESDHKVLVLRRIRWATAYVVKVFPDKYLGERAQKIPVAYVTPEVSAPIPGDAGFKIPDCVAKASRCANDEQKLWRNPKPGRPGIRSIVKTDG